MRKNHGCHGTKLYYVWQAMKSRCYNPNNKSYSYYGGRGITVCEEWKNDFLAFRKWAYENGYEEKAEKGKCTIDRIDVNGNYEPSNCRWVDRTTQANNRRSSLSITCNNETHTGTEWSRIKNLSDKAVSIRLKNGWDVDRAVNAPKVFDKERTINRILDILRSNEIVTYNDLTIVCTKCLVFRYLKELEKRGYSIIRKRELRNVNGNLKWLATFRLEGEYGNSERNDIELH